MTRWKRNSKTSSATRAWPSSSWRPIFCLKNKLLHIRLKAAAESRIRSGHPWVFSDSIKSQNREAKTGELAVLFDRNDNFFAAGLYDPESPIRVRIVHRGKPAKIDVEFWRVRLREAISRRAGILDATTNGLRWVNGESDGFPGLVLDQYADTFVLKLYSAVWFSRLEEITLLVREEFHPARLILRLSRNIQLSAKAEFLADASTLIGNPPLGPIVFLESGLKFEADVLKGQKTGFFLDQRENRRKIGELSRGKEALNAFSFSGGFSVYAASASAQSVTDIDISAHALESARRNMALNPEANGTSHVCIQADVFEWLSGAESNRYDIVILDPPSLAKREAERAGALVAYRKLAMEGLRLVRKKGVLLCCSCSAHVSAEEFFATVENAASRFGRAFRVTKKAREPRDHPASFPEAEYLKAIYLEVE